MIDPKKELFKWGPIDARPIYVDSFIQGFKRYPKFIDGKWPDVLGLTKNDKVTFICDYENLRDNGLYLFRKYVLDKRKLKQRYDEWEKTLENIKDVEDKVNKGLSKIDGEELEKDYVRWDELYIDFWIKGFLPELSNWGGEKLLKQKILEKHEKDFVEIFEKLSAPNDLSFFQNEEIELLRIKLIEDKEEREKILKEHQKKYYWKENNYGFTKITKIKKFEMEIENIANDDAKRKIKEIEDYPRKVKFDKERTIRKFNIAKEIVNIAESLAYCVWWQDYRKKYIFIANHIFSEFLKEISRRKSIPFKELCYYTTPEIRDLLSKNKRVDAKNRFRGFLVYYHENKGITHIEGKDAIDKARPYLKVRVDKTLKQLKGMVVSRGNGSASGKVRMISSPREVHKLKKGDILVTAMTSPDFVVAMRKAAAIITDEGGMTSHAAIVSRELKKPCIVGTKIATKILKNNDIIEVDTTKGIITILKRKS